MSAPISGQQAAASASTSNAVQPSEKGKEKDTSNVDSRREADFKMRDKTLGEFLVMLADYKPLIPDEVTDYYLQKSGFECDDPRLRNLLSLATQKFISDIATDAFHYAKLRGNITGVSNSSVPPVAGGATSTQAKGKEKGGPGGSGREKAAEKDKNRVVLTMDDLSLALGDHGIKSKRPDYYF